MYNQVSSILKEIEGWSNKKGSTGSLSSIKNVIYRHTNSKDPNFKSIYKLSMEIIKHKAIINEVINHFFDDNSITNLELLKILIYEQCIKSRKCRMGGKIAKIVKDKKDIVKQYIQKHNTQDNINSNGSQSLSQKTKDRSDTIMNFRNIIEEDITSINGVIKDNLIKDLYSIDKEKFQTSLKDIFQLRDSNKIIIQSKASCLPPYLLYLYLTTYPDTVNSKCTILDTCSAPGNKTLQLGSYFPMNQIFAYEINKKRYEFLNENITRFNKNKNIITINQDFLLTDPNDKRFDTVEVFLVDPSCSGSGTVNNSIMNDYSGCVCDIAGSEVEEKEKRRLNSLASFQLKILSHCLKFPNVKVISYSTCSVFSTENENVIESLIELYPKRVSVIDISELITNEGKEENGFIYHKGLSDCCKGTLRMCRKCHNTDGFYVALIKVLS